MVPFTIDEFPLLFIAASLVKGVSKFYGIGELRHKESDRIKSTVAMISAMGGTITEYEDGFELIGKKGCNSTFEIDSFGDHRIAMSAYIAAVAGHTSNTTIHNIDCINTSFPNFMPILNQFTDLV